MYVTLNVDIVYLMVIKLIKVHAIPNLILPALFGAHPQAVPPKNEIITPP